MIHLSLHFAEQGHRVDLVVGNPEGPRLAEVRSGVRLVALGARRALAALPPLVSYLRRERPKALLSSMEHVNLIAVWARRMSRASTRLVLGVPNVQSENVRGSATRRERFVPWLARLFYPWADEIVAVSRGAADDLARSARIDRRRIRVIYNPVVTPELLERAGDPAPHPWLERDPSQAGPRSPSAQKGSRAMCSNTAGGYLSRRKTRSAFSRRNFGQTSSRNGTCGMSWKMRSSDRPIGK